eukprot:COSAG01_NODE_7439_length_3211_cov_20.375643_2_plen_130_part_00
MRGRQETFPCGRLNRAIRARKGGKHGALGGHLPAAKTTWAHTAHKARRAMARLGESNTPEHLAGEGNGGQQLATLLGRQGTYSAPASQLPSHAKTIARPKTIALPNTRDNQRQEAAPFEDSRRRATIAG